MVRFKNRYLLFEIDWEDEKVDKELTLGVLYACFRASVETNFGEMGLAAMTSLSLKYFDPISSFGIVRVSRDHYRWLWASLTFTRVIHKRVCAVRVLHTAGTLRSAQRRAIRHHKSRLVRHDTSTGAIMNMSMK